MKKKTVSLVLGSGGARGLAHIGVIEQLIDQDCEIKSISGSSIGALIGGIYALDKLDIYKNWVSALRNSDIVRLLDVSFSGNGLFKGERIIDVLKELIGDSLIEDLPIKYSAVAADLNSEKAYWFNEGPLFDAIRASIAIPTVFVPHKYLGRHFLDGSLVSPIPMTPVLHDNSDLIVAVSLNGQTTVSHQAPVETENNGNRSRYHERIRQFINSYKNNDKNGKQPGMFEIMNKSLGIMENALARAQMAHYTPDILIEIPRSACGFYEFDRAKELIEIGKNKARICLGDERICNVPD